jgi:hypothetical protein
MAEERREVVRRKDDRRRAARRAEIERVGVSLTLVIVGLVLMVYSTYLEWWPGLLAWTALVWSFGRIAAGAKRTETTAGPLHEKTDMALEESPTRQPEPERRPEDMTTWQPRPPREGTGPAEG